MSASAERMESGLLELTPERVDDLPETPAWFRLLSSGQRLMYVGAAGTGGLREAVREMTAGVPVAGFALIEYRTFADEAAAREAAQADIVDSKPLYNDGYGRFRNEQFHPPSKGHRVRPAMRNP